MSVTAARIYFTLLRILPKCDNNAARIYFDLLPVTRYLPAAVTLKLFSSYQVGVHSLLQVVIYGSFTPPVLDQNEKLPAGQPASFRPAASLETGQSHHQKSEEVDRKGRKVADCRPSPCCAYYQNVKTTPLIHFCEP